MRRKGLEFAAVVVAFAMTLALVPDPSAAKKNKVKSRPVSAGEQMSFGVEMAKRGLWREALFRFQRARQLDPGLPRVLNNMAVAFEAVGDFDRALEYYKLALEADPGNRDLRKNYALFVEFYQSFRPPEPSDEAAGDAAEEDGEEADAATG